MTTGEQIALGSLVVSTLGLLWGMVLHIYSDSKTRKDVDRLKRRMGIAKDHDGD